MKLEFDYGGRTFLLEKGIPKWGVNYVNHFFEHKITLEKDLLTGDDIYVRWDLVGVVRRVSEMPEEPQPVDKDPSSPAGRRLVAVEFDYGGRTFLVEKNILKWSINYVNHFFENQISLEKDLLTGEDIYVRWDLVGVVRRASEIPEEPRPVSSAAPPLLARQRDTTDPSLGMASEPTKSSSPSDKDAAKLAEASDPNTAPGRLNQLARMIPAARILTALNPSSPPSLLTWLHELKDPAIDQALRAR